MPQDYFSEYFIYCSLFIFFGADLDNSFLQSKLPRLAIILCIPMILMNNSAGLL